MASLGDGEHSPSYLINCAVAMSLLGGFANGWAANCGAMIVYHVRREDPFSSDFLAGWISSSIFLGGAVGSTLGGWLADVKGRKLSSMLGEAIILCTSMLSIISPNPWVLSILRTITGLGVGMCQTAKPIYVSELAPDEHRGRIMATFTLAYSAGLGLTKVAEHLLKDGNPAMTWRVFIIAGAMPATMLLITIMLFVPESPIWLDEQKAAEGERQRLNTGEEEGSNNGSDRDGVGRAIPAETPWQQTWSFVTNPELYRDPLRLSLILIAAHQLTGISIIMLNSSDFMVAAGTTGDQTTLLAIFIALAHFVGACVGLFITDSLYRRTQLLTGLGVLLVLMSLYCATIVQADASLKLAGIGVLYVWVLVWQATVGPSFSAIVTEVFPISVRSTGISVVFSLLFLAGFLVLLFYSTFKSLISIPVFCVVFVVSNIVVLAVLSNPRIFPETRGINLYDCEDLWKESPTAEQAPRSDKEYSKLDDSKAPSDEPEEGGFTVDVGEFEGQAPDPTPPVAIHTPGTSKEE